MKLSYITTVLGFTFRQENELSNLGLNTSRTFS